LSKEDYKEAILKLLKLKETQKPNPEIIVAREFNLIKEPLDYNDMQCVGGKSFLSMKPNGDITPCSYLYRNFICGNITKDKIEDIWMSRSMVEFSEDYLNPSCQYVKKCRGGCKAITYRLTRSREKSCDPYCWVKK
jgi:radical SAM protein with 4Fe4S-binding SPASM domain